MIDVLVVKGETASAMASPTAVSATILIVDDNIQNRKLLEALLRREGYVTISAADGKEALASIAKRAPDLILLDVQMPRMDGNEVARTLKANPVTANIPIIMVTAHVDQSSRLASLNAGAEDFLTKPVDAVELSLRVRNLLRLKEYANIFQNRSEILEHRVAERMAELERARATLLDREIQLNGILESTADAILAVDNVGKVIRANRQFAELWHIPEAMLDRADEQAMLDLVISQLNDPEDFLNKVKALYQSTLEDIDVLTFKDGRIVERYSSPLVLDGAILGRVWSFRDVTQSRMMENQLRDRDAFRDSLLQAIPIPVFYKDTLGRYTGCNRAFAEFIGKTKDHIVGKSVYEVAPQNFASNYRDKDIELLADPVGMQAYESCVVHADGTTRDVIFHKARIADNAGRATGIVGAIVDMTEVKRQHDELLAAEEQFRGLVEQSIAGIMIIQNRKFAYVNPRVCELHGYASQEELLDAAPFSLIAEKDRPATIDAIRQLVDGEALRVALTMTALRKDGSTFEAGTSGARATYRGHPAVIIMMQDISEKSRAEEEIRDYVEQLKAAFMSTVEVATIISGMRDPYTAGHERRVAEIAVAIGTELGLDGTRLEGLRVSGQLHDVGKITVPAEILSKPGKLTELEFLMIKQHAKASYDVLKDVKFPWPVAQIALQHHERMDGSGYPQGLKGDAILIEARIMAVADVVEAMSSHRPYRPGLGIVRALDEIEHGRATAYDTDVVDACLKLFREKSYTVAV